MTATMMGQKRGNNLESGMEWNEPHGRAPGSKITKQLEEAKGLLQGEQAKPPYPEQKKERKRLRDLIRRLDRQLDKIRKGESHHHR